MDLITKHITSCCFLIGKRVNVYNIWNWTKSASVGYTL